MTERSELVERFVENIADTFALGGLLIVAGLVVWFVYVLLQ
jgi:hypothetical protein